MFLVLNNAQGVFIKLKLYLKLTIFVIMHDSNSSSFTIGQIINFLLF